MRHFTSVHGWTSQVDDAAPADISSSSAVEPSATAASLHVVAAEEGTTEEQQHRYCTRTRALLDINSSAYSPETSREPPAKARYSRDPDEAEPCLQQLRPSSAPAGPSSFASSSSFRSSEGASSSSSRTRRRKSSSINRAGRVGGKLSLFRRWRFVLMERIGTRSETPRWATTRPLGRATATAVDQDDARVFVGELLDEQQQQLRPSPRRRLAVASKKLMVASAEDVQPGFSPYFRVLPAQHSVAVSGNARRAVSLPPSTYAPTAHSLCRLLCDRATTDDDSGWWEPHCCCSFFFLHSGVSHCSITRPLRAETAGM